MKRRGCGQSACVAVLAMVTLGAVTPEAAAASNDSDASPKTERARSLAHQAMDLMQVEQWAQAQRLLAKSYRLKPAPTLALLEGEALVHLGRFIEARQRFQLARAPLNSEAPAAFHDARTIAAKRLEDLEARTPRLVLSVAGAFDPSRTRLSLDGVAISPAMLDVEQRVDPGEHVFAAQGAQGHRAERVVLAEGARATAVLTLASPQQTDRVEADVHDDGNAAHTTRRRIGWSALGIGAAGVTTGVVSALVMQDRRRFLDERCTPECPAELRGEVQAFERAKRVSWVGYGAGAAGLATGAVLLLIDRQAKRPKVEPWATTRVAGIRGEF